ncbi:hypothetical protein Hdeb2414_s0004g00141331 [Helianthus debilis subsp. tardiflorus]
MICHRRSYLVTQLLFTSLHFSPGRYICFSSTSFASITITIRVLVITLNFDFFFFGAYVYWRGYLMLGGFLISFTEETLVIQLKQKWFH